MTNDVGFILFSIENNSFFNNLLPSIKQFIDNNPYKQICIFNSYCSMINTSNIPILHIKQAKFFTGDIFVFDIIGLMLAKDFPNVTNKYWFTNNIPWQDTNLLYSEWEKLFNQPKLNIIAQNQKLFDIFDITWKTPVGIAENVDYESLSKLIR